MAIFPFKSSGTSDKTGIYATSPKQIEELRSMGWTQNINIAPVPEQFRYEFVSAMLKQNFQRMVQGAKFGIMIIGLMIFLLDVLRIPMTKIEILKEHIVLRYVLFMVLVLGYLIGKRLRINDPNAPMMGFFVWANLFRGSFALIVYLMFYGLAKAGESINGAYAIFVGIFSMGLYANVGYMLILTCSNALIYAGIILATTIDGIVIFDALFTGFSILAISGFSATTLFKSFCHEFANRKQMEEEQQKALELNQRLSQANEEISRQIELLSEQSREIELANTMLQERGVEVEKERDRARQLLDAILPRSIAERLQAGEETIANTYEHVTVMFADIVGFTKLSAERPASEIVTILNRIFSAFDIFSEQYNLEKIKTIGDSYMIVGGLPEPHENHCTAVVQMAIEMQSTVKLLSQTLGIPIELRIGIHTGTVVAGVIGKKKFAYDLWGDTVNTASRMESHGEAGKIHISDEVRKILESHSPQGSASSPDDTQAQIHNLFILEERGEIEIKGKGMMQTYFLRGAQ